MTRWAVLMVMMVGCVGEPPETPGPPEVRLIGTTAEGAAVMLTPGQALDLGLLSNDCPTTHALRLVNVGGTALTATPTTDSAAVQLTPATVTLAAAGEVTLALSITTTTSGPFSARLRVAEAEFVLSGLVVTGESDWPSRVDFGGVQVGTQASLPGLELTGATPPFESIGRTVRFSPTAAMHHEQRVTITRREGCVSPGLRLVGDGVAQQLSGPPSVEFGAVPPGTARTLAVSIENLARLPLRATLDGADFVATERAAVPATRDADGGVVAGEVTFDVTFTPSAVTQRTATLELTSGTAVLRVPVRGN